MDIHDPYVKKWDVFKMKILNSMPEINKYDAVVLAVSHKFYTNFKFIEWIGNKGIIFMDANNILAEKVYNKIKKNGNKVIVTGRGDL